MKKQELTEYLNFIGDAVHESKFGPLYSQTTDGKPAYNTLGMDLVKTIIMGMGAKSVTVEEPKQGWQE